jgi:uncharacterized membrane protein
VLHWFERSPQWMRIRLLVVVVGGMSTLLGCGGGGGGNGAPNGNNGGNPAPSPGEAQSDTTPPSSPTGLAATAVSSTEINLSWSASATNEGVTGYKVYRNGTVIATVATTSHTEAALNASTQYCYDITASDAAGNESAHSAQTCATTTGLTDATPPTITSTLPANSGTDIAVDTQLAVVFGKAMNGATLNAKTFSLADASKNPIGGTVSYSGRTATFSPTNILAPSQTYTATIAAEVTDLAGNPLGSVYSWTFTTGLSSYALTAVGDDPAGDEEDLFTLVTDLNEKGEIAGEAIKTSNSDGPSSQESIAFLWRNGRLIDLGALSQSVRDSRSQGINDQSEVIGWSYPGVGIPPAFLWRADKMTAMGLEDAYAINNAGQVAGYITRTEGVEAISVAVVWQAGQITELRGLVNPWNINEAGDVVGFSAEGDEFPQASLWSAGIVTRLGRLPGAVSSQAFDINSGGLIVGTNEFAPASAAPYDRAFLWQSGKMIELPRAEATHTSSNAYGINDRGHVVGRSGALRYSAAAWFDGEAYDLNELIASDDPLKPYITLLEAREINNRGQIIAQGTDSRRSGSYTGFLLTPKRSR